MKDFATALNETQEVGYVIQVRHSIVYVSGIPKARVYEIVLFEGGEFGQVLSLSEGYVEVMLFSTRVIHVGTKVARTNELISIEVGDELLGKTISPLGIASKNKGFSKMQRRLLHRDPPGIMERDVVNEPLETGVSLVDLIIPIGKGQRQLVIGDRKTGKTLFLFQTILSQVPKDTICVYAGIAKWQVEIKKTESFFREQGLSDRVVLVASAASDAPGLIFLTPYAAMSIAEYFKDQGKHVLLILDDLTRHAQFYREITLLARRFPGRSSYPGDIFYIHSRLLERAGKFKKGIITCIPVVESVGGDLSGYIQTNIMSMTDGHLFFDSDYFNQGRRPAVNPFLSVTRVGHRAHTYLLQTVSQEITTFLVRLEKLSQLIHFGVELSPEVKNTQALGDRLQEFFNQSYQYTIPISLSLLMVALLWQGFGKDLDIMALRASYKKIIEKYIKTYDFRTKIDQIISKSKDFADLQKNVSGLAVL